MDLWETGSCSWRIHHRIMMDDMAWIIVVLYYFLFSLCGCVWRPAVRRQLPDSWLANDGACMQDPLALKKLVDREKLDVLCLQEIKLSEPLVRWWTAQSR